MTTQQKLVQKKLSLLELGNIFRTYLKPAVSTVVPVSNFTISNRLTRVKD
jgi:hypothetical protein